MIPTNRVSRVVIAGSWYSIQVGTFKVVPLQFEDENGQPLGEPMGFGYDFLTIDRDRYTGPLADLQLIKLTPD